MGCALLVALAALAGCGSSDGDSAAGPAVVVTTSQAADLVRNVAGERADVTQILAANADPHEYEPRPSDAEALANADLIVRSGGDVDEWLGQLVESSGSDAPELTLADHVHLIRGDGGEDPHWWQDPRNAVAAVTAIRDELDAIDPAGATGYDTRARRYSASLERLDREIAACVGRVPAAKRKLVTSHDALGYYARRYGIRVIGAVIPALTTAAQPSAGDVAKLVDTIEKTGVRTLFAESSVNPKVEQAIARQTGARIGPPLWADALGPKGSSGATYLGSIAFNTRALADGFTSGAVKCSI